MSLNHSNTYDEEEDIFVIWMREIPFLANNTPLTDQDFVFLKTAKVATVTAFKGLMKKYFGVNLNIRMLEQGGELELTDEIVRGFNGAKFYFKRMARCHIMARIDEADVTGELTHQWVNNVVDELDIF